MVHYVGGSSAGDFGHLRCAGGRAICKGVSMPIGHGSRTLHLHLSTIRLSNYEDYLDWIENHSGAPAFGNERLILLLRFAAILTATCCIFSRLLAIPKK
jgi:hypothetical protein